MLTYAPCRNPYKRKTSINDVRWDDRDVTQVYASLNDDSSGWFYKGDRIVVNKLIQKIKYMESGYKEIWNDNKRSMVDQATAEHVPKKTKSQWRCQVNGEQNAVMGWSKTAKPCNQPLGTHALPLVGDRHRCPLDCNVHIGLAIYWLCSSINH